MNATNPPLLQEVAGMRLVLVHLLARFSTETLKAMSEEISEEIATIEDAVGERGETWMAPYRGAVDDILARAAQISEARERDDPQKDR
jgi:hypothetical protein